MPSVGELVREEAKRQVPKAGNKTTATDTSEQALVHFVKTSKPTQTFDKEPSNTSCNSDSEAGSLQSDSSCVFYDAVSCLSVTSNESCAECSYKPRDTPKATNDCKHIRIITADVSDNSILCSEDETTGPEDFVVPGEDGLKRFGGTVVNPPTYDTYRAMKAKFPFFVCGVVSRGFGRGSRDLGTPTANINKEAVAELDESLLSGVYYGWAKVDPWPVMKMVSNLGWNPFFEGKERNLEVHILHKFPLEFYGARIRVAILGYLRPEAKFGSLKDLIDAIKNDVNTADKMLDKPENLAYRSHSYFSNSEAQK